MSKPLIKRNIFSKEIAVENFRSQLKENMDEMIQGGIETIKEYLTNSQELEEEEVNRELNLFVQNIHQSNNPKFYSWAINEAFSLEELGLEVIYNTGSTGLFSAILLIRSVLKDDLQSFLKGGDFIEASSDFIKENKLGSEKNYKKLIDTTGLNQETLKRADFFLKEVQIKCYQAPFKKLDKGVSKLDEFSTKRLENDFAELKSNFIKSMKLESKAQENKKRKGAKSTKPSSSPKPESSTELLPRKRMKLASQSAGR